MKRIRKKIKCIKCGVVKEIHGKGECIKCYNQRRRRKKKYDWAYYHPKCIVCKTTKNKHHGKGFCVKCRTNYDLTYLDNCKKKDYRTYQIIKNDKVKWRKKLDKDKRYRDNNKDKVKLYCITERALKFRNTPNEILLSDIKILKQEIKKLNKELNKK